MIQTPFEYFFISSLYNELIVVYLTYKQTVGLIMFLGGKTLSNFLKVLFVIVIIAMAGAAILQIGIPSFLGNRTDYGLAPGWQREIGYWNIGMIVILIYALIKQSKEVTNAVAAGTATIGILFGTNHLVGFLSDTSKYMNLVGSIENYFLVTLLIVALIREKRGEQKTSHEN